MIESNDNIIKNLDSSNDLIKMEAKKMNDYLKSNEAFQIAIERLKSESFHNVSIIEAKEEGIEEGKKEVILNMHKKGMEIELIAKAVNLSIDDVNKILNN